MDTTRICNMSYAEIEEHVAATLHCEAELIEVPRSNMDPEVCLRLNKGECISFVFHLQKAIKQNPGCTICDLVDEIRQILNSEPVKINMDDISCEQAVPRLVNTEANEDMLKDLPHRDFLDLSIIYEIPIASSNGLNDENPQGTLGSAKITNKLAKAQGFTEEQLFGIALQNMEPKIRLLCDVMAEMMGGGEDSALDPSEFIREGFPQIYVLSNKTTYHGAAAVLKEDLLKELSEKLGSDLYIMPSSIHEVLIVAADRELEAHMLLTMIGDVNSTVVKKEDQLSNSLYRYNPAEGLTLAGTGNNL